ncbi:CD209 antigen-like protein C [Ochotona princeps]|uniref:CD209 antigen-like protein C n=1 Tax=Ochotona princeps TaxID=9978 RepID=UPI0027148F4B|nr:CD209 antigen-like protein C [Ochotona princeps]
MFKATRERSLGPVEEDDLLSGEHADAPRDLELERVEGVTTLAGHLRSHLSLVLQLLCLLLCAVLLVAILAQVSKVPSCHRQAPSKTEEIHQDLMQLKAGLANLCRPCPWDWTFFQGHCYFFSKSQRNWHDSVLACQDVGAQLVIVRSDEEQSFLQLNAKSRGPTWMGLSDLKKEGTWHWVDGSPLMLSFMQYWSPGEPNNNQEEDCGEFKDNGWNDEQCSKDKFWVCKQPMAPCEAA